MGFKEVFEQTRFELSDDYSAEPDIGDGSKSAFNQMADKPAYSKQFTNFYEKLQVIKKPIQTSPKKPVTDPTKLRFLDNKIDQIAGIAPTNIVQQPAPQLPTPDTQIQQIPEMQTQISQEPPQAPDIRSFIPEAPLSAGMVAPQIGEEQVPELRDLETREREVKPRFHWKEPDQPLNAVDKLRDVVENPDQLVPFLGDARNISELTGVLIAAKRLENDTADAEDVQLLREFVDNSNRDKSFAYQVFDILSMLPKFAGELAITGGVYTGGKQAALAGGKKALEKILTKEGSKLLTRKLTELALKSTATVAGATLQAIPAGITAIPAKALERMVPELSADELDVIINQEGEDVLPAITKALGDQWVEVVSERSGAALTKAMGGAKAAITWALNKAPIKAALLRSLLKANPAKPATVTAQKFKKALDRAGWNGIIEEMFEERVGEVGRAVLDLEDYQLPSPEQLAVELVAFAIPGASIGLAQYGEQRKELKEFDKAQDELLETAAKEHAIEALKPSSAQLIKTKEEVSDQEDERIPGEVEVGKEPVEAGPVQEPGKEEIVPGRDVQIDEQKEEVEKPDEEKELPEEQPKQEPEEKAKPGPVGLEEKQKEVAREKEPVKKVPSKKPVVEDKEKEKTLKSEKRQLNKLITKWANDESVMDDSKEFTDFARKYYDLGKEGKRIIDIPQGESNIKYPPFLEDTFYNLGKQHLEKSKEISDGLRADVPEVPGVYQPTAEEQVPQPDERAKSDGGLRGQEQQEERPVRRESDREQRVEPGGRPELKVPADEVIDAVSASQKSLEESEVKTSAVESDYSYEQKGGRKGAVGAEILSAYFTPPKISNLMQDVIEGFTGKGGSVLEPAAGTGNLIDRISDTHNVTAIEINQLVSHIAKAKNPKAKVLNTWSEKFFHDNKDKFDAVISNPPYNQYASLFKGKYKDKEAKTYTEYFMKETARSLNDDGVAVFLVPHSFLEGKSNSAKEIMAENNMRLVKAWWLPDGIFGKNVKIPIDLMVFKKDKANPELYSEGAYFAANPADKLGEEFETQGNFGRKILTLKGDIDKAVEKINADIQELLSSEKKQPEKAVEKPEKKKESVKPSKEKKKKVEPEITKEKKQKTSKTRTVSIKGTKTDIHNIESENSDVYDKVNYDGSVNLKLASNPQELNYYKGKVYPNFNYLFGNIIEKLKQLELDKDKLTKAQYKKQKDLLESVKPEYKQPKDIRIDPKTFYVTDILPEAADVELDRDFRRWLYSTSYNGKYNPRIIDDYLGHGRITGYQKTKSDQLRKEKFRLERRNEAMRVFSSFLDEMVTKKPEKYKKVVDLINEDYFGNYVPDFKQFPFSINNLSKTFNGNELVIKDHQQEAIGFLLSKQTGYFAGEVGSGKTMVASIIAEKLIQIGRAKRPLIIAPKKPAQNFLNEIEQLFPEREVVYIGNMGANYKNVKGRDGVIYVGTHQALENITYTPEQIKDIKEHLYSKIGKASSSNRKEELDKLKIEERFLSKLKDKNVKNFSDLGFDALLMDEAHYFKNLFVLDNAEMKLGGTMSARSIHAYMLSSKILKDNNDTNVFMFSATPFNNQPAEIYNILSFIASGRLDDMGISNLDEFARTFSSLSNEWVANEKGQVQSKQVVTGFNNLTSLQSLIRSYILPKFADDLDLVRPEKKRIRPIIKNTGYSSETFDRLRIEMMGYELEGTPEAYAQAAGIRMKMRSATISPYLVEEDGVPGLDAYKEVIENSPKLNYIVDQMDKTFKADKEAGQILYMPVGKDIMPHIREYLIKEKSFEPEQVVLVRAEDASKEAQFEKIKNNFNDGKSKVIIGTSVIREGVNLQKRGAVVYHPLIEWNPTDVLQVEGRIFRQGNRYQEIKSVFPLLENSGDSAYLQKMEEKSRRFNELWTSKDDFIDVADLMPEEAKLDIVTNPSDKADILTVMKKDQIDSDIQDIESVKVGFNREWTSGDPGWMPTTINKTFLNWSQRLPFKIPTLAKATVDKWNNLIDGYEKAWKLKLKERKAAGEYVPDWQNKYFEERYNPETRIYYSMPKDFSKEEEQGYIAFFTDIKEKISQIEKLQETEINKLQQQSQELIDKKQDLIKRFEKEAREKKEVLPEEVNHKGLVRPETKKPVISVTEAVTKITTDVNKQLDELSQKGAIALSGTSKFDEIKLPPELTTAFLDKDVEERFQAAKTSPGPNFIDKSFDLLKQSVQSFQRHFDQLDTNDSKQAEANEILRVYEAIPAYASTQTISALNGILADFGPKKYDLFTKIIILDDIQKDIESGMYDDYDWDDELQFGLTKKMIVSELDRFKQIANANEDITTALEKRTELMTALRHELVRIDALPKSVLEDDRYFHHRVIEHLQEKSLNTGLNKNDVRITKRGWQRHRIGSIKDFISNYLESEFTVISQGIQMIQQYETLKLMDKSFNIKHSLKAQAKESNMNLAENKWIKENGIEEAENDPLKAHAKTIAIGFDKIGKLAENNGLDDSTYQLYPKSINELIRNRALRKGKTVEEIEDMDLDEPEETRASDNLFGLLNYVLKNELPGSSGAAAIFTGIRERENYLKEFLGDEYETWKKLANKLEGYSVWQPELGRVSYPAYTLPDKIVDSIIKSGTAEVHADLIKQAFVLGGLKPEWVIPTPIANQMDKIQEIKDEIPLAKLIGNLHTSWKQWTLINPYRLIKYNLNNLSGDLDIALAYDWKMLKYVKQSNKDAFRFNFKKGAPTKDMQDMIRLGVIDSGMSVFEIPDINNEGVFRLLMGENKNILLKGAQYGWAKSKDFTMYRENVLRIAAYRYFLDRIRKGDKNIYAASKRSEVDAIRNMKSISKEDRETRLAAKLARELIGDYGNTSRAGRWLSRYMWSFYRWIEVNSPRYYRLLVNAKYEGEELNRSVLAQRSQILAWAGIKAGTKVALKTLKALFLMQMLYTLVQLWNRLVFPDEFRQLGDSRRQMHFIFGHNEHGEVMSIRFQGAFSDVLETFGLGDYWADIEDLFIKKVPPKQKIKEAKIALTNKVTGSINPYLSNSIQLMTGQRWWPDIYNPRPIRDRLEFAAGMWSMQVPYNYLSGKPTRGWKKDIPSLFGVYITDPDESAYYEVRGAMFDIANEFELPIGSGKPTDKSNALYYYKKAVWLGDEKAKKKFWNEYLKLGGSRKSMERGGRFTHPMGMLQANKRVTDEKKEMIKGKARRKLFERIDRQQYDRALRHWRKLYGGTE